MPYKNYKLSMINFFKKSMQGLNEELAQDEQLRVNAENEEQAMSCGAFNPRFLAMIKRSNADKKRTTGVKPQRSKPKLPEALLLI
jgi:hypothetical protein